MAKPKYLPTRESLLSRIRNRGDEESWREFVECYGRLIYGAARRAGLMDPEAQDVVQETIMSISQSISEFQYNPKRGSFKNWLMGVTRWRIADQFRKRDSAVRFPKDGVCPVEELADPNGNALARIWDEEWEKNILDLAVERVKLRVDPKQYQVFDLSVFQGWPIARIASTLKLSPARIYMARYRVVTLMRKEVTDLKGILSHPQTELKQTTK